MDYALPNDPLVVELTRELRSAERILWQGRPLARLQMSSFGVWIFAVPWTAFSIFWTAMALAGSLAFVNGGWGLATLAFPPFGVPFVAVGLGLMATPFWQLYAAKRTIFAVTYTRLIKLNLSKN